MNPELPDQVDRLYDVNDPLAHEIMRGIARKATQPEVDQKSLYYWLERERDALRALDYAQDQIRKIRGSEA